MSDSFISPWIQKQNTSSVKDMELEKLRLKSKRSAHLMEQWKKLYDDMQSLFVSELMDGEEMSVS